MKLPINQNRMLYSLLKKGQCDFSSVKSKNINSLINKGLIELTDGQYRLTSQGIEAAIEFEKLKVGD